MVDGWLDYHRETLLWKCDGLSDEQLRTAHLFLVSDVATAVADELRRVGPEARVCVLPEGPQTVAYVASEGSAVPGQ